MGNSDNELLTIGQISKREAIAIHKLDYAIRTRGIAPDGTAGRYRMYGPEGVLRILEAVSAAEAKAAIN
jgi:DNA-binding transcriptional MerR regulator